MRPLLDGIVRRMEANMQPAPDLQALALEKLLLVTSTVIRTSDGCLTDGPSTATTEDAGQRHGRLEGMHTDSPRKSAVDPAES